MNEHREPAGQRFTIAFHAVMCAAWIALLVVKLLTHFSSLVYVGIGAGLGIAGHGLSVFYGVLSLQELRRLRQRVVELEANQRPTRRDPVTGRYVSRKN